MSAVELSRAGRPLAAWLLDLVSDRREVRRPAGESLQAIWFGIPEGRISVDELAPEALVQLQDTNDRFAAAVRATVAHERFPAAEFVERLCDLQIRLSMSWLEHYAREQRRRERTEHLLNRSHDRLPDGQRVDRLMRVEATEIARDSDVTGNESITAVGVVSHFVFQSLDVSLLTSPDALLRLMNYPQERWTAFEALSRIGPPALRFVPTLLNHLDSGDVNVLSSVAYALGSVGRDDPATVAAVLARLDHPDDNIRRTAIGTLGVMGTAVAGRTDEILDRLLSLCDDDRFSFSAIQAAASVGPTQDRVLARVLAMIAPRPPRIVVEETHGYRREYDLVMSERSAAIEAAGRMTSYAELLVPALIEALGSFVEYDPDMGHESNRVLEALIPFGPAAAPVIPHLEKLLAEDEVSDTVYRLIAAIGRAAVPLLPQLLARRDDDDDSALNPARPFDAAILALQSGLIHR